MIKDLKYLVSNYSAQKRKVEALRDQLHAEEKKLDELAHIELPKLADTNKVYQAATKCPLNLTDIIYHYTLTEESTAEQVKIAVEDYLVGCDDAYYYGLDRTIIIEDILKILAEKDKENTNGKK